MLRSYMEHVKPSVVFLEKSLWGGFFSSIRCSPT